MSPATRIVFYGSAGLMVICGAVCAAVISGEVGQLLALVLIGLGLVLATAFVFMEVGLSEDRERAREDQAREEMAREEQAPEEGRRARRLAPRPGRLKRPNLERSRGHRRRLS
ncbi:MAG TPA: hypothetical protein VGF70_14715 [Solirubrobacteraceae bacterium]|jgi:hypothetical protein